MHIPHKAAFVLATALFWSCLAACSRPEPEWVPEPDSPASVSTGAEASAGEAVSEAAAPPQPVAPRPTPPVPSTENLMATIDTLCSEPRPLGSRAERRAAEYLRGRLADHGYQSELAPFSYNITASTLSERYRQARQLTGDAFFAAALPGERADGDSQNVIGRQPAEAEKAKILVLSAHYDSTPDSVGVVDNATGVAVVLEAARILAADDLPFAVRIVLLGGEEEILIGSRLHLLGLPREETGRMVGNITVDTLAYSEREEFVVLTPLALGQEDTAALAAASPVAGALLADPRVTPAFRSQLVGDHMAFAAAGIDSVNFGQPMDEVMGLINSPLDTYDLLVPELLPVATQLLVDTVRRLADEMAPAQ